MIKIKGKDIYKNGEKIGRIIGQRNHANASYRYHNDGYGVELNDGTRLAFRKSFLNGMDISHGEFAYFQDCARWVREGGIEQELSA